MIYALKETPPLALSFVCLINQLDDLKPTTTTSTSTTLSQQLHLCPSLHCTTLSPLRWPAGTSEALAVSDPAEAWIFHILPDPTGESAIWAAQRVNDEHFAVMANMFVIRQVGT